MGVVGGDGAGVAREGGVVLRMDWVPAKHAKTRESREANLEAGKP